MKYDRNFPFSLYKTGLDKARRFKPGPDFEQRIATKIVLFLIHGSVHRNSVLIRSNKMQQYAGIYLLQNYSTCFGCPSHPSSGEHKTLNAASGTGHSI